MCVDLADLKVGDRVFVGSSRLTGEVVRLDGTIATVQVFEENRGLGIGEPVTSAKGPLTVRLGPGLLGGIFDGLQRPLPLLRESSGDFITSGQDPFPLDCSRSLGSSARSASLVTHCSAAKPSARSWRDTSSTCC